MVPSYRPPPLLHYLVGGALLQSIYGTQVCPYVESLSFGQVLLLFGAAFTAVGVARRLLHPVVVLSRAPWDRPRQEMLLVLGLHLTAGFVVAVFDTAFLHFPAGSGVKMVAGFLIMGVFSALDVALSSEQAVHRDLASEPRPDLEPSQIRPITRKMSGFLLLLLALASVTLTLVIVRDVQWLLSVPRESASGAPRLVLVDVTFVALIFGALGLRILYSFSRNLDHVLCTQVDTLGAVSRGDLDHTVPVLTRDEFGLIAVRTNHMITGLREKERIRSMLGKVVSPQVRDRLLAGDLEAMRRGSRQSVTVLFSDLRGFTTLSEKFSPEEIVDLLNRYFARMVEVITSHGGVVDKFIGDAVLAVFGFEDPATSPDRAVRAALEMAEATEAFRTPGGDVVQNGFGVHHGAVIAGVIGSPDRFEFTVIGDTVNTASRLEGLTKSLGRRVLLTREVLDRLEPGVRARFDTLGAHPLKGKAEPVELFGEVVMGAAP